MGAEALSLIALTNYLGKDTVAAALTSRLPALWRLTLTVPSYHLMRACEEPGCTPCNQFVYALICRQKIFGRQKAHTCERLYATDYCFKSGMLDIGSIVRAPCLHRALLYGQLHARGGQSLATQDQNVSFLTADFCSNMARVRDGILSELVAYCGARVSMPPLAGIDLGVTRDAGSEAHLCLSVWGVQGIRMLWQASAHHADC